MQDDMLYRVKDTELREHTDTPELVAAEEAVTSAELVATHGSSTADPSSCPGAPSASDASNSPGTASTSGASTGAFSDAGSFASTAPLYTISGNFVDSPMQASPWSRPFDANRAGFSPTTVASFQAVLISIFVLVLFTIFMQALQTLGINPADWFKAPYGSDTYVPPSFFGFTLKNVSNLDQVLALLPFAFVGCCLLSGLVVYIARESRSRDIDWTDSHLMLEHSGPLTLAIRWSAIELVQQFAIWDIFNGKQPAFLIRTREGNQFKLKLSDISKKHNIGTFFSLIKTSAPKAALHVDPGFASDNSYTELWLKYFSVPAERQKTGMLENSTYLDAGRYEIVGTVGGGGQGTAYLANVRVPGTQIGDNDSNHIVEIDPANLVLHEQVVLKEYVLPVHRGQLTAERTADKLRAEAQILQKLDHPQIVKLKDAFVEDFRGYLVLEYVSGESLKTLVERLGPQPEELVIDWALRACDILEYMHQQAPPVVHRDITPDNLMLQEDGMIKIVDFNVAYQVDSSATSTVVGKHAYIPAEQFRGKAVPQSDIYSLGGTLFFLLTASEPTPITQSHPARVVAEVSKRLDAIVARATSLSLSERYSDIAELKADLQELAKRA